MNLTKNTELSLLHDPAQPNRALKTSAGMFASVAGCAACRKCRLAVVAVALAAGATVAMISASTLQAHAAGQIITHGPVAQRPNGEIVRGKSAGPRAVRPNGQVIVGRPGTGNARSSGKSARVGATPGKGPQRVGARPGKPTPRVRDFRESRRSARARTNSGKRR